VNPAIWRNGSPLATLNVYTGRRWGSRRLEADAVRRWNGLAIVLLLITVPARRLVFNHNGVVLAVTIAATGGLALTDGVLLRV
jgi:hypothetical protein